MSLTKTVPDLDEIVTNWIRLSVLFLKELQLAEIGHYFRLCMILLEIVAIVSDYVCSR